MTEPNTITHLKYDDVSSDRAEEIEDLLYLPHAYLQRMKLMASPGPNRSPTGWIEKGVDSRIASSLGNPAKLGGTC